MHDSLLTINGHSVFIRSELPGFADQLIELGQSDPATRESLAEAHAEARARQGTFHFDGICFFSVPGENEIALVRASVAVIDLYHSLNRSTAI